MDQPWYDRGLEKIIYLCRIVLLLFLGIVTVQAFTTYPDAEFLQASQPKWVLAGLTLAMAYGLFRIFRGIYRFLQKADRIILQIICMAAPCVLAAGQLLFLLYYRSLYMWDTAYVVGGATGLVKNGQVAKEAWYYYSIYPNQNAFAVLTQGLLKIADRLAFDGGQTQLFLNAVNMLSLDLAIWLGILVWKKLREDVTKADLAFVWIVILTQPFFYMGVSYYYTITLSLPWLMGAVYLIVSLYQTRKPDTETSQKDRESRKEQTERRKSVGLSVAAGIVLAVGFLLRATTGIVLIAAVFCSILPLQQRENTEEQTESSRKAKCIRALVILLTMLLTVTALKPLLAKKIGIDTTDTAFPATHWVMMSLTSPGCHNAEDEAYTASFATAQEKKTAVMERMHEKLTELGVRGYGRLVLDKLKNTWASGANSYVLFMENCLRMDGIYPYLFGNHKDFAILYHQGIHLLMLVGMILSVLLRLGGKRKKDRLLFLLQLTLLGGFLFYVLWETSGQYSLPFFLLMILLALDGYRLTVKSREPVKRYGVPELVCLVFVAGFFAKNALLFTAQIDSYKAPVVNQLIADKELEYRGEEPIVQTFRTGDSFNELIFQWRNPAGEQNHAVYRVSLTDEGGRKIWEQKIEAAGQGYAGAFLYDFDPVTPNGEEDYTLTIQKTEGNEVDYLQFVSYECGDYDAYPFGKCTVAGENKNENLMFQVARVENRSYTSPKRYWSAGLGFMAVFLLMTLSDIGNGLKRKKKGSYYDTKGFHNHDDLQ